MVSRGTGKGSQLRIIGLDGSTRMMLEWSCEPRCLSLGQTALEVGILGMAHEIHLHGTMYITSSTHPSMSS